MVREVTGIPENLGSDYSLEAKFDSNKQYHGTEYIRVNRMIRLQNSRSKVDVITILGTKITRLCWPYVSVTMANGAQKGKRNGQLVYTWAYVSRKKKNEDVMSKRLLSAT